MSRTLSDSLRWQETGTRLLLNAIDGLDDERAGGWDEETLPGWTGRHLVAHLAANAEALSRLVTWAATGVETPMYASAEARAADIAEGSRRSPRELVGRLRRSVDALDAGMTGLTPAQWRAVVRTGQGRLVPATEIPWLRAREVYVHAVDLGTGTTFADMPDDFLATLADDIATQRGLAELPDGPLAEVVAWLAGRSSKLSDPALGPWL